MIIEYIYIGQHFADYTLSVDIDGDSGGLERAADTGGKSLDGIGKSGRDAAAEIKAAFADVSKTLQTIGGGMTKAGKAASVAITAPVIGIAKASADAFQEVDSAMDMIIAKTGASGEQVEEFEKILENVATSIPVSFGDAGTAIGEVSTRFGVTGQELEDLSSDFLKFAQLNKVEVGGSVDSVQQAMAAFGVETKDAGLFLDTLNKVGQDTGVNMDTLLGLMESNATSLKEMGYGASDSAVFLGNLSKNGIESNAVMTGLKKALVNASKEGKSMPKALAELQAAMTDTSGDVDGLQMAIDLFGSKSGPAIYDACRDGRLSFEELGTSLQDSAGSVSDTFDATQGPSDAFKEAMSDLTLAGRDLAEVVQGRLAPYIDELVVKIDNLRTWFSSLSPEQQDAILKFVAIAAAIGPVLVILGKLISGVGSIAGAIGGLTGFIGGLIPEGMTLGGVFASLSGAVLLPVAAIAALVGAFVYLWQTNEDFRNKVTEIWDGIVQKVQEFVETVKAHLEEAGITGETLRQAWDTAVQAIKDIWQAFCDFLAPIFIAAFETISNLLGDVLDVILGVIDFWIAVFQGDWSGAWAAVQEIVDGCLSFIEDLVQGFIDLIDTHFSGLADFLEAIWNFIKDAAETVWNALVTTVLTIVMLFCDLISGDFDGLKEHLAEIWDRVKDKASEIWETIKQTVCDFVSGLVDFISEHIDEVPGIIESGFQKAIDFITSLPGQALTWGADIIDGIVDGIWSGIGRIQSAASEIASTISSYLGFSEPDIGPLSDFHTYMPDMISLMTSGMSAGINKVGQAAEGLAGSIFGGFAPAGTSQAGAYAGAYGGNTTNVGGVTMIVNAQPGQDVSQLADLVSERILERARI